jgi:two-component system, cell cycle response regulator DivK
MMHRVMIVEPDRLLLKMFNDLLVARGYEPQMFADPGEALAFARERGADLMLVSVDFPDESGLELIRSIKSDSKIKNTIPVIVMFDYASNEETKLLHETGCLDYIAKPVDVSRLFSVVEKCLGR